MSLRLKAVQVIKYVPMEVRNPFGKVEGGFVYKAADENPFAGLAKKPVSNNVLANEDDEDDEPTPKKKSVKKTAPKDTGDIAGLVDDLFDDDDD